MSKQKIPKKEREMFSIFNGNRFRLEWMRADRMREKQLWWMSGKHNGIAHHRSRVQDSAGICYIFYRASD